MRAELEVRDRHQQNRELSLAGVAFDGREDRPRTRLWVALLRRRPVREQAGVAHAHRPEARRGEIGLYRLRRAHLVGVEQLARHLALEGDVLGLRRNDELAPAGLAFERLAPRPGDAVALRRIGDDDLPRALRRDRVDRRLECGRVVRHPVALGAEVPDVERRQRDSGEKRRRAEYGSLHASLLSIAHAKSIRSIKRNVDIITGLFDFVNRFKRVKYMPQGMRRARSERI